MRYFPLLLPLLLAACGSASEGEGTRRPDVIFVCMDTVRADHLGCYGHDRDSSPNLDALAERSILFADASATACWTKPSVPSYLTGTYPLQHGVYRGSARDATGTRSDALPEAAWTIAEAFSEAGYQTGAFVRNAQLRHGLGFEQGFDVYLDEAGDARKIRWQAEDWLDGRDRERPYFLYLHFLDAHWPYDIPDEAAERWATPEGIELFRREGLNDAINDGEFEPSPEQLADLLALYDGAIRYIDDQLGLLFNELEQEGTLENTVICVLSDHGEEFLEHGRIGHGHALHETLLQVPWILHVPEEPAFVVNRPVSLVDVFPTVMTAARLAPSSDRTAAIVGVDRLVDPGREVSIFAEHLGKFDYERSQRRGTLKIRQEQELTDLGVREREVELDLEARYKATLGRNEDGSVVLTEVEEEDDDEDAVELKGLLESYSEGAAVIAGVEVRLPAGVDLYGETEEADGSERELAAGVLVKAKGRFEGRMLVPTKIKLYEAGAEVELEVRGILTAMEDSRIQISGRWFDLAADADLPMTSGRPRMTREAVRDDALGIADTTAALRTRSLQLFDLSRDPAEVDPRDVETHELAEEFQGLARALATLRFWGEGDQRELSAEDIDSLREIGYAD